MCVSLSICLSIAYLNTWSYTLSCTSLSLSNPANVSTQTLKCKMKYCDEKTWKTRSVCNKKHYVACAHSPGQTKLIIEINENEFWRVQCTLCTRKKLLCTKRDGCNQMRKQHRKDCAPFINSFRMVFFANFLDFFFATSCKHLKHEWIYENGLLYSIYIQCLAYDTAHPVVFVKV